MKQNYYPHFRGQNRGTERLSNLPSSGVHAPLSASVPFKDNSERLQSYITISGRHSDWVCLKKKKNWFYYTVTENRFPNRKPTSFQCLKNPENYKQNLSNFNKNFKGVDPDKKPIKNPI